MNKSIISLLSFLIAGLAHAQTPLEVSCWDGSFAYNTLKISETDAGFEVGIKGAEIGPLVLERASIIHVRQWRSRVELFQRFAAEDCTLSGEDRLECEVISDGDLNVVASIFVARVLRDIDGGVSLISPAPAYGVKFVWDRATGMELSLTGARYTQDPATDIQTVEFRWDPATSSGSCERGAPGAYAVEFPERLRTYLDQ